MSIVLRHVGIVVNNLAECTRFWTEVMGYTPITRMREGGAYLAQLLDLPGGEVITVKLKGPCGEIVELLHFISHPGEERWQGSITSTGLTHLAFTVANVDDLWGRMSQFGCTKRSIPVVSQDGSAKVLFVEGPERLLLELVEVGAFRGGDGARD